MALGSWRGFRGVGNLRIAEAPRGATGRVGLRGNQTPLGDQESVGGDGERGVMVEASPAAAFVVTEADLLLELLIVRSMRQRSLAWSTRSASVVSRGKVESQYLIGSLSPCGHSTRNHSSGRGAERQ